MAVIYRGKTPDRNYSIKDFYDNGVVMDRQPFTAKDTESFKDIKV